MIETKQLLELWKQQEECISCLAALAADPADREEQENPFQTEDNDQAAGEVSAAALEELFGFKVADLDGQSVKLGDTFKKPLVVLVLLRHFGCGLCRKSVADLSTIKSFLDTNNIGMIAVGSGTPLMANSFQKEVSFPGDLYCDKERNIYKALGCSRGLKYIINSKALEMRLQAHARGFKNIGGTQGDALQLGGVFLVSRKDGIVFQHLEEYAGDHVSLEELTAACTQFKSK